MNVRNKEYDKAYHLKNKEKRNAQSRAYREANKEKCNAQAKAYYEGNKERWTEYKAKWYQENKAYYRAKDALRGSRKKATNEITSSEDKEILREIYALAKQRTLETGFAWEVDHIQPISKGGKHSLDNLQVVPRIWNRRKHNRNADKYVSAQEK
jgi:5-methylcytosine-specific restriction endonuclease McrA